MGPAVFEAESVDDSVELIVVSGELDISNSAELRRRVEQALEGPRDCIVLDLHGLTYMDSSGIAALIYAHQVTSAGGGGMAVVVASPSVRRTLEVRGLDGLLTMASSRREAIAAVCN
jgi:anti-anti-sigma factor